VLWPEKLGRGRPSAALVFLLRGQPVIYHGKRKDPVIYHGKRKDIVGRYVVLTIIPQRLGKFRYRIRNDEDEAVEVHGQRADACASS
jgi:hypothetical protein